jgi:hypothetical protein
VCGCVASRALHVIAGAAALGAGTAAGAFSSLLCCRVPWRRIAAPFSTPPPPPIGHALHPWSPTWPFFEWGCLLWPCLSWKLQGMGHQPTIDAKHPGRSSWGQIWRTSQRTTATATHHPPTSRRCQLSIACRDLLRSWIPVTRRRGGYHEVVAHSRLRQHQAQSLQELSRSSSGALPPPPLSSC